MCQSMVNIQSPTAEIRRGKKERSVVIWGVYHWNGRAGSETRTVHSLHSPPSTKEEIPNLSWLIAVKMKYDIQQFGQVHLGEWELAQRNLK